MRVGLLGVEGEFSDYKTAGTRFYRYMYYTTRSMKRQCKKFGIELETIEPKMLPVIGKGLSILSQTKLMDLSRFDVIHNFDINPFSPLNKGKAVIVTTAHDFQPLIRPDLSTGMNKSLKNHLFNVFVSKRGFKATLHSDYLIAVSTLTRDDAVSLGFPRKKIFVVNHGVDKSFLAKAKPKKKGAVFNVGYMGAFHPRKNPQFLFKTFNMLHGDDYSIQLWGKLGYDRDELMKMAAGDVRIHFNGFAPDDEFVKIYDSFDVLLFPSFYEGFGIPIIEAQARGVPVVIYKYGKIPAETRKYCIEARNEAHAAEIIQNLKKNGYSEKQRKRAMDYARGFTWEKTAEETLKVYKKIGRVA